MATRQVRRDLLMARSFDKKAASLEVALSVADSVARSHFRG